MLSVNKYFQFDGRQATDEERLRKHLLQQITKHVPRGWLEDFHRRTINAYREKFHDVRHDPAVLPEQQLAKLIQDRMFRLDWELAQSAAAYGLPATSKPLPENAWVYTYVVAGSFGLTQSYVPTMGALPKPAKFRDDLALAAGVPRLPLDDPKEIYESKDFYALFAHNPLGRKFNVDDQQLGTLQFCIPCKHMNCWTFAMSFAELISHYPITVKMPKRTRAPTWKRRIERGGG